jgi:hypothetical protein
MDRGGERAVGDIPIADDVSPALGDPDIHSGDARQGAELALDRPRADLAGHAAHVEGDDPLVSPGRQLRGMGQRTELAGEPRTAGREQQHAGDDGRDVESVGLQRCLRRTGRAPILVGTVVGLNARLPRAQHLAASA